jgi:hypothetical protein
VVGTLSYLFPSNFCLTPAPYSLDSPELGPGTVIGASDSKHTSNARAIAGGVVGGIAVITICVVAVVFFLRRRHSQPSSATSAGNGASNSHKDQVLRPFLDRRTVTAPLREKTSLMKTYVCVSLLPVPCVYSLLFFDPSEPQ